MTQELQIFKHEEFGGVRVVEQDGEIYFVAADVCKALEIKNVPDAVSKLDDDEKMTVANPDSHSGQRGGAQFLTNCCIHSEFNIRVAERGYCIKTTWAKVTR